MLRFGARRRLIRDRGRCSDLSLGFGHTGMDAISGARLSVAGIFLESILRPNDLHNGFYTAKTLAVFRPANWCQCSKKM